jgi:hypothetical protein
VERRRPTKRNVVRFMQTWVADKQLMYYTYTPALQKRATMPKPARILAVEATAVSWIGKVCFGRLGECISWAIKQKGVNYVEK